MDKDLTRKPIVGLNLFILPLHFIALTLHLKFLNMLLLTLYSHILFKQIALFKKTAVTYKLLKYVSEYKLSNCSVKTLHGCTGMCMKT